MAPSEKDIRDNMNLLPYDGTAVHYKTIMDPKEAEDYFNRLYHKIDWKHDEVIIFGKHIVTKRKTAWYGDEDFSYTYSKINRVARPWIPELLELRSLVEQITGSSFNSCLLNLYPSGEEGMGWHSDNEKPLGTEPLIASLSLGAQRKFSFKHKSTKEKLSVILESGSLLEMKGSTQQFWLHSLPKTKKVAEPRINLTFRQIKA